MTVSTTLVPFPTATEFPRTLGVARPDDADSLRAWLAWMSLAVWPTPPEHPPWSVRTTAVAGWPTEMSNVAWLHRPDGHTAPLEAPRFYPWPNPSRDAWTEHYSHQAAYFMTVAATAHGAARVLPPGPDEWDDMSHAWISLYMSGVRVDLDSWQQIRNGDTPALWLWSLADRTEVRSEKDHQARRAKQRGEDQLVPALVTAHAIHDALALLLPQLTDDPSTPPQKRNASWR